MAAPFPYPGDNWTSALDLFTHANTITDGFLGTGILIVVSIISFISMKAFSTDKAVIYSAFLCFVLAILFRFLNLISDAVLYVVIILFGASMVWLYMVKDTATP